MFRIDFAAKVRQADGTEQLTLICSASCGAC